MIDYNKKMEKELGDLPLNPKPKLLLHICCGPCSSYVLERLEKYFDITAYFYNPNIYPEDEYSRRLNEVKEFYKKFPQAKDVSIIETDYVIKEYFDAIEVLDHLEIELDKEKGERCRRCYKFRMEKAYNYAKENKFDYFCTSLSISPHKDSEKINIIGEEIEKNNPDGPKWLYSDFKKESGFLRSLEISKEYNLYRQDYCGCIYSFERFIKLL